MIRPYMLAFAAALSTALPSSPVVAGWPEDAFPVKSHDFGTVAVAAKTEFRFPIVNQFNAPMHIQSVRASCGCTTPIVETDYIPAGGKGSILARFNTSTFRGKKGATLTVVIDKPVYAEVRLRVDGYIRSDMVFHPGAIEFGKVEPGTPATETTKVLYAGRGDWKIVDVRSNQPWLQPSFRQTVRGQGKVNYEISVSLREDAPEGFFQDEIVVITNDRAMPNVPLKVSGTVEGKLSISPQSIALGSVKPGESIRQMLVIRGAEPFKIESIRCEGWDVDFEPSSTAKKTHIVAAHFTPKQQAQGAQKVSVTIKTAGDNPVTAQALLTADVRDQ